MTGASPVVRRFPMIPGIDFAGIVEHSDHPEYKPGDAVVLTGWGVGETHLGAYAEKARVKADWLVPLPAGLSPEQAMAIGTAGYTAMLCLMALDAHGVTPKDGPALVTGAAGGVGSVAVALAGAGRLARDRLDRAAGGGGLPQGPRRRGDRRPRRAVEARPAARQGALGRGRRRGRLDTLANVLAQTKSGGAVAACGLAQGMDLPTSVAPFILRGVSLLGINSVTTPAAQAPRRVGAARRGARPRQARGDDPSRRPVGGRRARRRHPLRQDPRTDGGADRLRRATAPGESVHERNRGASRGIASSMSIAFVREKEGGEAFEDLPDRPISPHTNFVTPAGLEQIEREVARLQAEQAKLKPDDKADTRARHARPALLERAARHGPACRVGATATPCISARR